MTGVCLCSVPEALSSALERFLLVAVLCQRFLLVPVLCQRFLLVNAFYLLTLSTCFGESSPFWHLLNAIGLAICKRSEWITCH